MYYDLPACDHINFVVYDHLFPGIMHVQHGVTCIYILKFNPQGQTLHYPCVRGIAPTWFHVTVPPVGLSSLLLECVDFYPTAPAYTIQMTLEVVRLINH